MFMLEPIHRELLIEARSRITCNDESDDDNNFICAHALKAAQAKSGMDDAYICAADEIKEAIGKSMTLPVPGREFGDSCFTLEVYLNRLPQAPEWWKTMWLSDRNKQREAERIADEVRLTWIDRMLELGYIA
ncbi:hypothetical protein CPT_Maja_101 [Burkholderia phage Maja]|uniref:Uncharacterized protein n=1 Tax=Burkholderia phage Maja TaxID=2767571 RepID=A0A7S6R7A8_9CAUD|nr:hypothetical protein CPT_Maja_101 [Burkholderia phage Maja]